jgi:hypothetical protein
MNTPPPDPYAKLSLGDRLELLAFDARLAGVPQVLLEALRTPRANLAAAAIAG